MFWWALSVRSSLLVSPSSSPQRSTNSVIPLLMILYRQAERREKYLWLHNPKLRERNLNEEKQPIQFELMNETACPWLSKTNPTVSCGFMLTSHSKIIVGLREEYIISSSLSLRDQNCIPHNMNWRQRRQRWWGSTSSVQTHWNNDIIDLKMHSSSEYLCLWDIDTQLDTVWSKKYINKLLCYSQDAMSIQIISYISTAR